MKYATIWSATSELMRSNQRCSKCSTRSRKDRSLPRARSLARVSRTVSQRGEGRSIQLRERVTDREPRRFRLDQDVSLGPQARIVVEYSGVHFEPRAFRLWIGY